MKKVIWLLLICLLAACSEPTPLPLPPTATYAPGEIYIAPTLTRVPPTATLTATVAPPTYTPLPTFTSPPTATPAPSLTPLFTATETPADEEATRTPLSPERIATLTARVPSLTPTVPVAPIRLSGRGDSDLDLRKWGGPALLQVDYRGTRSFRLQAFAADESALGTLLDVRQGYQGILPLDFDGSLTTRLKIDAGGDWELTVLPLSQARSTNLRQPINGVGAEVLALDGAGGLTVQVESNGFGGQLVLVAYGGDPLERLEVLVEQDSPFSGSVTLPAGITYLVLQAPAGWRIMP